MTIKEIIAKANQKLPLTKQEQEILAKELFKKVAKNQPNKKWKTFRNWK
jgi:hypothetical protein